MPGCSVGKKDSRENRCPGTISKACEAGGGKCESPAQLAFIIHPFFSLEGQHFNSFSKLGCTFNHDILEFHPG